MKNEISQLINLKLNPAQRAMLILIKLGIKPSTEIALDSSSDVKGIEKTIHQAGLYTSRRNITTNNINKILISVAACQELADKLERVSSIGSDEEYGLMMGYPQTAVEGFVKGDLYPMEQYPEDMQANPLCFKLSNKGHEEEIALVREWMHILKKEASAFYDELYSYRLVENR